MNFLQNAPELQRIERLLAQRRVEFERRLGEAQAINRHRRELESEVTRLGDEAELYAKAIAILQSLSSEAQQQFITSIETLISEGLSAVFGEDIKLHITPTIRNKQVNLDLSVEDSTGTTSDILEARGGGLVALCGVLLQLLMVRLLRDRVHQVVLLDEPLGMLSSEYQPAAMELLQRMSLDLDIQIILVSHQAEALDWADTVYEIVKGQDGANVHRVLQSH